ncbi:hypothetical protein CLOM_g9267 [Closterium sp. NIES-68]|nr:hypothetical protein CLOM_g9267 [Closterium sp. NIES-68]GJP58825.1 hypothetical protein CLOP_g3935 [Closterium sp. NIES-67]
MQLPICFLRIGLSVLMGEGKAATLADLVYFLLTAGSDAKGRIITAAINAGSDSATAAMSVEVLLGIYGREFEGAAAGEPATVIERTTEPILGLKCAFPECAAGPKKTVCQSGRVFQWGGVRRGETFADQHENGMDAHQATIEGSAATPEGTGEMHDVCTRCGAGHERAHRTGGDCHARL